MARTRSSGRRLPAGIALPATIRTSTRAPFLQVVKTAVAMILAWTVASIFVHGELPVFATIAALLVVQPSVNQSVGRAIERSIGVIVGVVIAYLIGLAFGTNSWIVLLAVVVSVLLAWALRLTPGTANQVPITAMLVLAIGASDPQYALARIVETVIGAVIGVVVNVAVVPPVLTAPARQAVIALGREIASTLDRLATALTMEQTRAELDALLIEARLLRPMETKAQAALTAADESLSLNPRQRKHRVFLQHDQELFDRLRPLINRTLGMTRAYHDHYDDSLAGEPTIHAIADELHRAAHDLRLLARDPDEPIVEPGTETAGIPVLTAPLTVATPDPRHWVLIGSLVEDLRRIHVEIAGDDASTG
ncbi:FUSC family protein [Leifsonia sp. 21MFCrub1.1]|uniref:FUSC family protein n=1 Tax=Leifsonia sp. 21MFCrub1.1 TaxID=1798223 RepID=UPI0008929093|nr:aromatic acid exporter family protein [Leifsonia sp. 21MFCrub1.1]SEA84201.1 Aromatic acid exporter family member 1 [Leifsonia sp. 21MFCrub1.1]